MTEIVDTGENVEIELETADIEIVDTPAATVVVIEETQPAETGATISQLVETISALNSTIIDLRLQIETERVNNMNALFEMLANIDAKLDVFLTAQNPGETSAVVDEPITEPSGKERGRRWL